MRRLSVTLATLVIALVLQVEGVQAGKLLHQSPCCCQPKVCLPTVCGPARAIDNQAVETLEQPLAEPAEDVSPVAAPELPPTPQVEEAAPAEEAPPEQPPEEPAAPAEEATPAEEASPAEDEAATEMISGDDAEKPVGSDEAMSDEDALKAFFGEDAKEPAGSEDSSAPAKEPEAPKPAPESPAGDEEKSALDAFFQTQTQKPSPGDSPARNAAFRTWRDVTGQYELEARFVTCLEDGTVRLEKPNGRWVRLPYSQLSRADQLLARQGFAADKMIAMISR